MNHTKHPTTNLMLGAPAGWDQSKLPCDALPVTRVLWDGVPAVVSYWVPTPEELAALNAGHAVQLSVVGQTMPPVALGVDAQPQAPVADQQRRDAILLEVGRQMLAITTTVRGEDEWLAIPGLWADWFKEYQALKAAAPKGDSNG